jgi:hypothetical protein
VIEYDTKEVVVVRLEGNATDGAISVDTTSVNFEDTLLTTATSKRIRILNEGNEKVLFLMITQFRLNFFGAYIQNIVRRKRRNPCSRIQCSKSNHSKGKFGQNPNLNF